jgi:hypothetical protein
MRRQNVPYIARRPFGVCGVLVEARRDLALPRRVADPLPLLLSVADWPIDLRRRFDMNDQCNVQARAEAQHEAAPAGCRLQLDAYHVPPLVLGQLDPSIVASCEVSQIEIILSHPLGTL